MTHKAILNVQENLMLRWWGICLSFLLRRKLFFTIQRQFYTQAKELFLTRKTFYYYRHISSKGRIHNNKSCLCLFVSTPHWPCQKNFCLFHSTFVVRIFFCDLQILLKRIQSRNIYSKTLVPYTTYIFTQNAFSYWSQDKKETGGCLTHC